MPPTVMSSLDETMEKPRPRATNSSKTMLQQLAIIVSVFWRRHNANLKLLLRRYLSVCAAAGLVLPSAIVMIPQHHQVLFAVPAREGRLLPLQPVTMEKRQ